MVLVLVGIKKLMEDPPLLAFSIPPAASGIPSALKRIEEWLDRVEARQSPALLAID